ncbi:DHA2 family multidrug resistance protein-like MFS transporter [Spinactinospora alkalitolerans]|uniref:DHA2 family multidrug resistance protein-like MFS transporter n=1 Tax=Spinactinospora alkalitolerans TaxID=687207 RepID=A0A852TSG4_9ACTN|nr:MFS transporter [Spinactinospora alkalitolerans]NYE46475.1 DHA2 family multidrug resistance protein-like MFS transporter [Spinactinospora alkalitolerans]
MSSAVARTQATPHGGTPKAGPREWGALAVLALPVLLISVDMTVLGFAVPALSEELAPTGTQLLWIVDIYSFVLAGLLVTMGTLGDRIGRRRLLLVGSAGFGAASLVAAYASSAEVLIAARALLGLAGATLMPSTLSLLRNIFLDPRQRLLAIAAWASMFSAGSALGPILGGWLLEHYHWGSVFLINLPVMALILVLTPILVRESRDPSPGRYDLPSVVLSMAAILPVVYGVKKIADGGPSVASVAAILAGLVLGHLFVRRQLRLDDPMIDVRLFRIRAFSVGVATNLMVVFALVSSLFFLTQYLQLVQGISPLRAGVLLLPGLSLAVAAHFVAVALARRLRMGTVIAIGLALTAAGFALLARLPLDNGTLPVVVAFALIGAGVGVSDTLTNDAIMTAAPPARAGAASAISETAYELGAALGIAVLGSVLTATYRLNLDPVPGVPAPAMAEARETLGGAVTAARGLAPENGPALMEAARTAFTDGIHVTSLIGALIVAYAAVQAGVLLRRSGSRTR